MYFHQKHIQLKAILFTLMATTFHSYAEDVSIDTYDLSPVGEITPAEFGRAQVAAGEFGKISFSARTYTLPNPLTITVDNLHLRGAGIDSTELVNLANPRSNKSPAVFLIRANNAKFTRMTVRGDEHIETIFPLYEREGSRVSKGTESAFVVKDGKAGLVVNRVSMRRVNVAFSFNRGNLPHGLVLKNSIFSTARAIIEATDNPDFPALALQRRFVITGNKLIREPGQPVIPNRGFVFDFGNSFTVEEPVDLKGSIIADNEIPQTGWFNIDANRVKDLTISDNRLGGGGAGPTNRFTHCFHFEDGSRNIVVENNQCHQTARNGVGELITLRAHLWTGGNNGFPEIIVRNNLFTGTVDSSIVGNLPNAIIEDNTFNLTVDPTRYLIHNFNSQDVQSSVGNRINGVFIDEGDVDYYQL